jgi:hypothetical protein
MKKRVKRSELPRRYDVSGAGMGMELVNAARFEKLGGTHIDLQRGRERKGVRKEKTICQVGLNWVGSRMPPIAIGPSRAARPRPGQLACESASPAYIY